MAGGEGVRLRPLTCLTPKPLVPLLGEPVMGYGLRLLKRHGCESIGATLWYQPEKVRQRFGAGDGYGVRLTYYEEDTPVGTAGSVKLAKDELNGTFFVLSGDGLTDCDLTAALAFHKAKGALATLVLKRVSVPLPYGVVLTQRDGKITRFIEKPSWSRVFSDLVNTGIYILEPEVLSFIPDEGMPDFGKDIFPALLRAGQPLFGFETEGYWCDVGDMGAYMRAQRDLLRGRVNLPHASGIDPQARVDPSALIEGDCCIGPGTEISAGARIKNAVIGAGCAVGRGATVENACLWDGAAVLDKARLSGCVLCDQAAARQGAEISDGCALGAGAAAGAFSLLRPGVKVGPHLKIAPGAVAARSILTGDLSAPSWSVNGAECDSPESICTLCAAYVQAAGVRRVLTGCDGAGAALSLVNGALCAGGAKIISGGEMTEPMLWALIREVGADGGVYAQGHTLRFFDRAGEALSAKVRSAMDQCALRQDAPPAFSRPGEILTLQGAEAIYLSRLLPKEKGRPLWSPVAIFSDQGRLRRLALEGLERMNARDARAASLRDTALRPGETGFLLAEPGQRAAVFTAERILEKEETDLLLLSLCLQRTGKIFDGIGIPRAAEWLSPLLPADGSDAYAFQQMILRDGLAAALLICGALKNGPLSALTEQLPETHVRTLEVACATGDKGRVLHALCDRLTLPCTLGEGVRIQHDRGFATIVPDAYRGLVRVTGESSDSEFARELCDFYCKEIKSITKIKNGV